MAAITSLNPPSPPFAKRGALASPFPKGGLRGIFDWQKKTAAHLTSDGPQHLTF